MKWLYLITTISALLWFMAIAVAYREGYVDGGIAAAKAQALRTEAQLRK